MNQIMPVLLTLIVGGIIGGVAVDFIYWRKIRTFIQRIDSYIAESEPGTKADKRKWWIFHGRNETANHLRATARAVFGVDR